MPREAPVITAVFRACMFISMGRAASLLRFGLESRGNIGFVGHLTSQWAGLPSREPDMARAQFVD
jgi:hypothetical protein